MTKYWVLFVGLFLCINTHGQDDKTAIDSLESALKTYPETDDRLYLIYQDLTNLYLPLDAKKSLKYAQKGIYLAKKKKNLYQTAEFYYKAGNSFYFLNQLDSALQYYEKSLQIQSQAEEKGTEDMEETIYLQLRLFGSIGAINDSRGKFDIALENYFQALVLAEKTNDPEEIIRIYDNLANTYLKMSNYAQAETYYRKTEQLCEKLDFPPGIADACLGLCMIQIERENYTKALEYGERAYQIFSTQAETPKIKLMSVAQRLTEVWIRIPNYNKALEYAQMTVQYAQETGYASYKASALYLLSSVYLKQKKYKESEQTAFQALNADSTNIYINSVLYGNIAQANIHLGNTEKSIEYFSKTLDANRMYSNKNFQTSLSEMEVKYETEKKELKISKLEDEKKLTSIIGLVVAALLLSIMCGLFVLYRYMLNKKRLAEQQVKQLNQEKQFIATQALLDGETQERTRLARDLHDGLGGMLSGVKLNLESIKKGILLEHKEINRFDNALKILNDSMLELRRVAHHLMPETLSRYGLKPAVSDFCQSISSNITFYYFGNETRFDPKLEIVMYRIVHELVNNALKHSEASQIMVQIMQESDRISLTVQDNGCGFNPESVSNGMGLSNIRIRTASFGGNIQIDSKVEEGTEINVEFEVQLPVV